MPRSAPLQAAAAGRRSGRGGGHRTAGGRGGGGRGLWHGARALRRLLLLASGRREFHFDFPALFLLKVVLATTAAAGLSWTLRGYAATPGGLAAVMVGTSRLVFLALYRLFGGMPATEKAHLTGASPELERLLAAIL